MEWWCDSGGGGGRRELAGPSARGSVTIYTHTHTLTEARTSIQDCLGMVFIEDFRKHLTVSKRY